MQRAYTCLSLQACKCVCVCLQVAGLLVKGQRYVYSALSMCGCIVAESCVFGCVCLGVCVRVCVCVGGWVYRMTLCC